MRAPAPTTALDALRARPALAGPLLAVLAWPIAAALLPDGAPMGIVLTGVVLGCATGLLAIGLILSYRTNRIINFAHGSIGGVAGLIAVQMYRQWEWNYYLAMAIGVLTGMAVGGLVE